jgi:CDP-paratose 2-epimerase
MTSAVPPRRSFGLVEWFGLGEYERVETILPQIVASTASYLRTPLSLAEYLAPGGVEWFDWLIPKVGGAFDLLPCVQNTPPSLSRSGLSSDPLRDTNSFADFVDHVLTRYGRYFQHIELWDEPNNLLDRSRNKDLEVSLFSEMVGATAFRVRQRGWQPVLGGPRSFDPSWLKLIGERGMLAPFSAVGFHGFPGTWGSEASTWSGWEQHLRKMRTILDQYNKTCELWITETGYSTWRNDEIEQARRFCQALSAPADRMYWKSWSDLPADVPARKSLRFNPRHYHLGIVDRHCRPKLLARLLATGGPAKVEKVNQLPAPSQIGGAAPIVIVGGSGFIGSNLAESYLRDGQDVLILDNLSRPGVDENLIWLKDNHGDRVHSFLADIRDIDSIEPAFKDAKAVFHFAAQTAVTTSLAQPLDDFEVNARGTINVLEAVRKAGKRAPVLFSSTNKVYGGLEDIEMVELEDRYSPAEAAIRAHGVSEDRRLDFCTPYGCSKGVADQYVLDYARSYDLPTAVLRMSCIYGPRQFGTEDQGWVAHFLIRALKGEPISIYGNGKQVRDILHVSDAVAAYRAVLGSIDKVKGRAFNLGGGSRNAVSLLSVLLEIERIVGGKISLTHGDWRQGDQYFFVADTRRLETEVGWTANMAWRDGIWDLAGWLERNRMERPPIRQRRALA